MKKTKIVHFWNGVERITPAKLPNTWACKMQSATSALLSQLHTEAFACKPVASGIMLWIEIRS
jgi:hypothetical protein